MMNSITRWAGLALLDEVVDARHDGDDCPASAGFPPRGGRSSGGWLNSCGSAQIMSLMATGRSPFLVSWPGRPRRSRPWPAASRCGSGCAIMVPGGGRATACCSAGSCVRPAGWRRRRPGWGRCWRLSSSLAAGAACIRIAAVHAGHGPRQQRRLASRAVAGRAGNGAAPRPGIEQAEVLGGAGADRRGLGRRRCGGPGRAPTAAAAGCLAPTPTAAA